MAQDTDQPAAAVVGEHPVDDGERVEEATLEVPEDHESDIVLTRRVHVVLGLVIAGLGAWLLYRSRTELDFRGPNHEPGPGYLPVLLTIGLIGLGLALAAAWLFGPRARSGDAPTLSLEPRGMARAGLVWLALVVCAFLIEPLGFLAAGEVLVLLVIVVIERMRSIPSIVALLLVPPAMYLLFATLLEVQLPGGTLWH
jgi:putative tricarboxylic transport membrane protein